LGGLVMNWAAIETHYLTFNRFNVRIDRESSTVTIEDELDPDAEKSLGIDAFAHVLADWN